MVCQVCGNGENNTEHEIAEMMFGIKEKFSYFQCCQCECLQILEIPEDLGRYYPKNYYSFSQPPPEKKKETLKILIKRGRDKWMFFRLGSAGKQSLSWLIKNKQKRCLLMLNLSKQSRILDVGSGSGGYLQSLVDIGFEDLTGVDPFIAEDIKLSNGTKIIKGALSGIKGQWDLITFNHSFEHMPEPLNILQSARSLLSDNGTCMLRVPIVSSFAWKYYGTHWVQIDAPRHLFLHSIESLRILGKQAGFSIEDIVYDSNAFQFWGSEQASQGIPLTSGRSWGKNRKRSIFSSERIREFKRRAKQLNRDEQGDQAIFLLKKV